MKNQPEQRAYVENTQQKDIYSVSRLNREARALLEGTFPMLWIEGEISNLARPSSGHIYFSLKDTSAQVRCAMFRNRNQHLRFSPANGDQILMRVKISLYEGRGEFQLIVEHMEEAGEGALLRAFEELKQRLANEGLFDESNKQPIPAIPKQIGVITSPTGAAIRDILSVLKRRFPGIPVLIYPVPVQGTGAAEKIAEALKLAEERNECDVLILARGGGSLEDLWAFNEEVLARAIYQCSIPIVCGVGHEVDVTIADFVADHRAPTPSAAAELLSPDQDEFSQHFQNSANRLFMLMRSSLEQSRQNMKWITGRLKQLHPGTRLLQQMQRLDDYEQRIQRSIKQLLSDKKSQVNHQQAKLGQFTPLYTIRNYREQYNNQQHRLTGAIKHILERKGQKLGALSKSLDTISPLATLERGYAIIQKLDDGSIITSAAQVKAGDKIESTLAKGKLTCTVDSKSN